METFNMSEAKPSTSVLSRSYETRLTRVEDSGARIEKEFAGFRVEVTDSFSKQNTVLEKIAQDNHLWRENQLKSRQTNWAVVIGGIVGVLGFIFAVFCASITLLWFIVTMQEKGDTQPIKNDLTALRADYENNKRIVFDNANQLTTIVAQNATSVKDRDDMRRDIYTIRDALDKTTLQSYGTVRDLQEVETQMKKSQDEFNLQHAHTERRLADFQNTFHEMNAIVPQATYGPWYFPTVPDTKK